MARYVLIPDATLTREYRGFPLLDFLPCAPTEAVPRSIYNYLKGHPTPSKNGRALTAPYAVRKLEAALLREFGENEVVVPHEDYIEEFIGPDTEVIGVSTMDPLGIGPLTMSYAVFFGYTQPYVKQEFEGLIARINRARRGTRAKLLVGGPGVWEFMVMPEELDRLGIDYAFQGEADDIAPRLFKEVAEESFSNNVFYRGYQTFDEKFRKVWSSHEKFLSRHRFSKQFPKLEEIPNIINPSIKSLVEVMRGCGIGCDFCEVTLRPLRYYPPGRVCEEITVNLRAGYRNAWLHSDEVFAYMHGRNFEPNQEALEDLFRSVMSLNGIHYTNPTHGRISIPAAYPELIGRLSEIVGAGPSKWVGIQVGLETGSERLARLHMPNKTLPLRIGPDGSWPEIVWQGVYNMNRYYWRPAFTVQVGQAGETPEDNWETVALINWLSNSEVEDRPFEFTVTPMQNVPLGLIKSRKFTRLTLDESQLAVYYASYRHLLKVAIRDSVRDSRGNPLTKLGVASIISLGAYLMYRVVRAICRRQGLDTDKVDSYGARGWMAAPRVA